MKREVEHCIVFAPLFERPPVFVPVAGARKTGMTACRLSDEGLVPYRRTEFAKLGLRWADYVKKCLPPLDELLDLLEPTYYRDENGVIVYAQILSEHPLTASVILSPRFHERFEDILGPSFFVAIPDRNAIVLLPKATGTFQELNNRIIERFKLANYPCSVELFEISEAGIQITAEIPES